MHHEVIITIESAHAAISEYNNLIFHLFANKKHTHMSHSRTSTTTNILSNNLLNPNHSKHHQIQLQALSTIILSLILFPDKHIHNFSDIWLLHKFHMLKFYRLIITKKTNC